jgi:hypothetical protein
MHSQQKTAFKAFDLLGWRRFEGLPVRTEPGLDDAVSMHALVHSTGDGFHFWQFRHAFIVEGGCFKAHGFAAQIRNLELCL